MLYTAPQAHPDGLIPQCPDSYFRYYCVQVHDPANWIVLSEAFGQCSTAHTDGVQLQPASVYAAMIADTIPLLAVWRSWKQWLSLRLAAASSCGPGDCCVAPGWVHQQQPCQDAQELAMWMARTMPLQ